jgi:hypothetical protein
MTICRNHKFHVASLFSTSQSQLFPVNSLMFYENSKNKTSTKLPQKKGKRYKYKSSILRKYYRGELPSQNAVGDVLSSFSSMYGHSNSLQNQDKWSYKNRYVINKLLKIFDTGNMLKPYSDAKRLRYLKTAVCLISKKKKILKNLNFTNYVNKGLVDALKIYSKSPASPFLSYIDKNSS